MGATIITKEDFDEFKTELIQSIEQLMGHSPKMKKKWLKSIDVMKKLGLSPGTLQTMRNNGTIPFTKLEGTLYYDEGEIDTLLEGNKSNLLNSRT